MSTDLDVPVAVFADDGLTFYSSLGAFWGYAEAFDVENEIYQGVFDESGREYVLTLDPYWDSKKPQGREERRRWRREKRSRPDFWIAPKQAEPDPGAVTARIREALRVQAERRGTAPEPDLDRLSLAELFRLEPPIL